MVRVNLINPRVLSDQHLIAEYREILMLLGYVRKHPEIRDIPDEYTLWHPMRFFKNKLLYLQKRHKIIRDEMTLRGFNVNIVPDLSMFSDELKNDWQPVNGDYEKVIRRITQRLYEKPEWYRYYRKRQVPEFFVDMMKLEGV